MFALFRRFRQSFVHTGSARKYLLYAFGEIALIVIGILLALQVNTWSEKQNEIRSEKTYLNGILNDLKTDLAFIDRLIPKYEDKQIYRANFDSLCTLRANSDQMSPQFLANLIGVPNTFFAKPGTYKSLISEGKIGIFRNQELRDQIQGVYEIDYLRLEKFGDRIDEIGDLVWWELREFRLQVKDRQQDIPLYPYRAEIVEMPDVVRGYEKMIKRTRVRVEHCIQSIEKEIL